MTNYKTIAESNNFIVLDKYTKKWQVAESYQSEYDLERELIEDLQNQGYEYLPGLTTPDKMLANVREALQSLNQVQFSDGEWSRFVETFLDKPGEGIVDKTRKIHDDYIHDFVFDDDHIQTKASLSVALEVIIGNLHFLAHGLGQQCEFVFCLANMFAECGRFRVKKFYANDGGNLEGRSQLALGIAFFYPLQQPSRDSGTVGNFLCGHLALFSCYTNELTKQGDSLKAIAGICALRYFRHGSPLFYM